MSKLLINDQSKSKGTLAPDEGETLAGTEGARYGYYTDIQHPADNIAIFSIISKNAKNLIPISSVHAKQKRNWDLSWLVIILFVGVLIGVAYLTYAKVSSMFEGEYWQLVKKGFTSLGMAIVLAAAMVLAVAILIGIQTLFSKWRKIRVFISYQHIHQEIVTELQEKLKDRWLDVRFIPFAPAEHDRMIDRIESEIRKSDVLLVLPGADKSFVDAEILAARTLRKIMIFLKISEGQTTPDTALKGYPVFDFNKLKKNNFRPLIRFIYHTNRLWKDTLQNFIRVSNGFGVYFGKVMGICFFIGYIVGIISDIAGAFSMALELKIGIYYWWGITAVACVTFGFSYFKATYLRLRAVKTARQKIITGELTYKYLEDGLRFLHNDRNILHTMHQGSLPLRY